MNDHWYTACLDEIGAFLDTFQEKDARLVRVDSDLVAALIGVMNAAAIQMKATRHLTAAGQTLMELGS